MFSAILCFVDYLRKAGFNIATSDVESCMQALAMVELTPSDFKEILQCSFVKDRHEVMLFTKLYNAFFSLQAQLDFIKQFSGASEFSYFEKRAANTDGRGMGQSGAGGPGFYQALVNEDYLLIRKLINAALNNLTEGGQKLDSLDFSDLLHLLQVNLEWAMAEYKVSKNYAEDPSKLHYYQNILQKVQMELELKLVNYLAKNDCGNALELYAKSLDYKYTTFNKLSHEQLELVKKQVIKLGRRLAVRKARRLKTAKHGRVSIRHTVRRAYSTGGRVLKVVKTNKVPGRPDILILCDLSNSVKQFSHFFLILIHAMQKRFRTVRTMIFVDRLEDITEYILKHDFPQVIEKSLFNSTISASGYSDFGRIFRDLNTYYNHLLKPKTTVIILGDAKNNWRPAQVEALKSIASRCSKIYWLNPRCRQNWYEEDSILGSYQPYLRAIYECRNLDQLKIIANQIF